MEIAITQARSQFLDLVRRAEAGEDIVLMRRSRAIARLVAIAPSAVERRAALEKARGAAAMADPDATAATSQNFLYDEQGMPVRS